jgi:hypothetical protein
MEKTASLNFVKKVVRRRDIFALKMEMYDLLFQRVKFCLTLFNVY